MFSAVQPVPANHPVHYERHRPERTLLYQLVQANYPAFKAHLEAQGMALPRYVEREFEDYLKCGRLEHGFLRVRCDTCHAEHLVAFSWSLLRIHAPATLVIPFTSQTSGLFARAAVRGAWLTTARMQEVEQCRSNCRKRRAAGR